MKSSYKDYIDKLCGSNVDYWVIDQICEELDKRDAEIAKLRNGIEDWLKRMEYYSDNQYGKLEMKEMLKCLKHASKQEKRLTPLEFMIECNM